MERDDALIMKQHTSADQNISCLIMELMKSENKITFGHVSNAGFKAQTELIDLLFKVSRVVAVYCLLK